MAGAWRLFEFDVTAAAKPGDTNSLGRRGLPFPAARSRHHLRRLDPQPPDKNMGLWRDVYITATGPVALRFPTVTTRLKFARHRCCPTHREGRVEERGPADGGGRAQRQHRRPRVLSAGAAGPGETRVVRFTQELAHPRLWWPALAGPRNLYPLDLQFEVNGSVSDSSHIDFGVREVTSEIDAQGHRLFHINARTFSYAAPATPSTCCCARRRSGRKPSCAMSAT